MTRRRILVVEDDDEDVRLMREAFEENAIDADVQFVGDGETAIVELTRPGSSAPDLIILDIELPGESGLSVLRRVRRCGLQAVPVVMFTASESLIDRDEALALGISAYMNKPLELSEYLCLGETVRRLVYGEEQSERNQPASRLSVRGKGLSEAS